MSSTTPRSHCHIAWLYFHPSSKTECRTLEGPFFNTGKIVDFAPLMTVLTAHNIKPDLRTQLSSYIFPQTERNEIPALQKFSDEIHKVDVIFENNKGVADAFVEKTAENKPVDVWVVFQPDVHFGGELEMHAACAAEIICEIVTSGGRRFNVGAPGSPIATFVSKDGAVSHARSVLAEKRSEESTAEEKLSVEEDKLDTEREVSYGVVVTADRAVRHFVVVAKVVVPPGT